MLKSPKSGLQHSTFRLRSPAPTICTNDKKTYLKFESPQYIMFDMG